MSRARASRNSRGKRKSPPPRRREVAEEFTRRTGEAIDTKQARGIGYRALMKLRTGFLELVGEER